MKMIDLLVKIANDELKENTLLKFTYGDNKTVEYWRYTNKKLYFNNDLSVFSKEDEMDLFSYLQEKDMRIEIIEDKPEKIEKIENSLLEYKYTLTKIQDSFNNEIIKNQNKINEIIDKLNYLLEKSDK